MTTTEAMAVSGGALDAIDRRLLDQVQAEVPLCERPFAAVATALGLDEPGVLARLRRLAEHGVLRQIGGIFDTRACGYRSALVAARLRPERIEAGAAVVGSHPGVTHCYERDHVWNLWFTLAVPPRSALALDGTAEWLGTAAGASAVRVLPALRVFKIGARFDMEEGGPGLAPTAGADRADPSVTPLDDDEIAAVRALQRPLPLVAEPFEQVGEAAGLGPAGLLHHAAALLRRGVMRRFAALLNHRRAGFPANVMVAWAVSPDRLDRAGAGLAGLAAVTHCYARPAFAGWPYTLFSMIHGRSREACQDVIDAARDLVRPEAVALLWTLREYKKTRLQLFVPDYGAWEARARAAP